MRSGLIPLLVVAFVVASGASAATPGPTTSRAVFTFVDRSRVAHFRNGTSGPRVLVTYVRYPRGRREPLPLIVFAHGFAVTPGLYARLLDAWAKAGYVVAAPVFPVENRDAPGGPDESDLVNQPGDMSFVISRLLAESARPASPLHGLVDPRRIAVAGQSDGGETAFAVSYESHFLDRHVRAAVILSGAKLPGSVARFPRGSPPLLAVQGTADAINSPRYTRQLFRITQRPKFLLWLEGASHLPPYSTNLGELAVVERTTTAFLDRYLGRGSLSQLLAAARTPRTRLVADP